MRRSAAAAAAAVTSPSEEMGSEHAADAGAAPASTPLSENMDGGEGEDITYSFIFYVCTQDVVHHPPLPAKNWLDLAIACLLL